MYNFPKGAVPHFKRNEKTSDKMIMWSKQVKRKVQQNYVTYKGVQINRKIKLF